MLLGPAATYTVRLLGNEEAIEIVRDAVARQVRHMGVTDDVEIDFEADVSPDRPSVLVAAWTPADDAALANAGLHAMSVGVTVLPVIVAGDIADVSEVLAPINMLRLDDDGPDEVARAALREVGLGERDRRVFISHRRSDGLVAAADVHDELTHRGWDVFIDRFGIESGEPFQEALLKALDDKAFLVVLETPDAHESLWVEREIVYATTNAMGVLVVNVNDAPELEVANNFRRLRINAPADAAGQIILDQADLEIVAREAEAAHVVAIARRRRTLVDSTRRSAESAGLQWTLGHGWQVHVTTGAGMRDVIATTARLPTVDDLYRLHQMLGDGDIGVVLHHAPTVEKVLWDLLDWTREHRPLEVVSLNAIGARWGSTA